MTARAFLKSTALPGITSPIERTIRDHAHAGVFVDVTGLRIPAAMPAKPAGKLPSRTSSRRTRIWELTAMLHCSIVGTCLTAGELRILLRKADPTIDDTATDHDLHSVAVLAAGRNDEVARRIQKALDTRHKLALIRFGKAETAAGVLELWKEALKGGDIPGAYWALLSHPLATDELARRAFENVHMLSHLVGAANRADIHKLRQLEEQKAALEAKLARQQEQLRDGILARDARIRELGAALSARIEQESESAAHGADRSPDLAAFHRLIADLRKQLDGEIRRRERAECKAAELGAARAADERARTAVEREARALSEELAAAESSLAALADDQGGQPPTDWNLAGLTILYVGGRPHQVARLRQLVERASGQFAHHDGGIEERESLLAGLVSRADVAAFPVDCISHPAAQSLKRLCQQAGKPFLPLRGSGMASLLQALRSTEILSPVLQGE